MSMTQRLIVFAQMLTLINAGLWPCKAIRLWASCITSITPTTGGLRIRVIFRDLYADPSVRGTGIGRKLIEAVYAAADADGCPSVYWMTQDFNAEARKLYDRIATLTPFIKYNRS